MRHLLLGLVLLFGMTSAATAAATAKDWQTDYAQSQLGFTVQQSGSPVEGVFESWRAKIAFDPHSLEGQVTVEIDSASASTGSKDRDQALHSDGLLHSQAFPLARFEADSFEKTGEGSYLAKGRLTLRETTLDADLPFTLTIEGTQALAQGLLVIDRLAYGVGQGQWADTSVIGQEVRITFSLTAKAQ